MFIIMLWLFTEELAVLWRVYEYVCLLIDILSPSTTPDNTPRAEIRSEKDTLLAYIEEPMDSDTPAAPEKEKTEKSELLPCECIKAYCTE